MTAMMGPVVLALAAVAVATIFAVAGLSAWRGWLALKRLELTHDRDPMRLAAPGEAEPATLIELASVKERLRRLEAIASGVEL